MATQEPEHISGRRRKDLAERVWSRSVPDPGQLVEVRRRQWVVSDIQASAFSSVGNGKQHLVTLGSLDEDSLGESLQVLWELEPGARVLERAGLPKITGWDSTDKLEAFLDAVRWGAQGGATLRSAILPPTPLSHGHESNTIRTNLIELVDAASTEAQNGPTNKTRTPATGIMSRATKAIDLMNHCDAHLDKLQSP